jgi:hypothetical protein
VRGCGAAIADAPVHPRSVLQSRSLARFVGTRGLQSKSVRLGIEIYFNLVDPWLQAMGASCLSRWMYSR